jgi:hypothetical protein
MPSVGRTCARWPRPTRPDRVDRRVSGPGAYRFSRCPKCGQRGLPADQSLPAACPACGVILAKVAPARVASVPHRGAQLSDAQDRPAWVEWLLQVPERVDPLRWGLRLALVLGLALWAWVLVRLDYRDGGMGTSFLHGPLLVFHEAGHVLFSPFGEWIAVLGGTLTQLLLPALIAAAFLWKQRDPFGAAVGLWLLGASLLDVAPYMYDALEPQLTLLGGGIGEEGGHDWIYLFESLGLRGQAQWIGALTHKLGALVILLALSWAGTLLWRQRRCFSGQAWRGE